MKEERKYKNGELIKRFLPYYKKYIPTVIFDLFCAALTTLGEIILPLIMRDITDAGLSGGVGLTVGYVVGVGALYVILRLIDAAAFYYMAYYGHVMGTKIETDMRRDAYSHLQKLGNTYFNNTKVGQIMGRITNDLFDVTEFSHHCPEEFFIAGIKGVVSFIILLNINVPLTLIIFAIIPVMLIICRAINKKMRETFREQRQLIGELNARIEDSLLGHKVVKAFTGEELEKEKFSVDNKNFFGVKKRSYKYMGAFQTTTRLFDGIMYAVTVIAGALFMIEGQITAGDLVAYLLYVTTFIATVRRIIEFSEQFQRGMTGIERFVEIIDADIEIFDEEGAVPLKNTQGNIEFKSVSFEYPDDHNRVFTGLDFSIKKGEKIAFVGPSGGGKTTLCNLIPRFYDVSAGEILIDGKNVKSYTLKSLRENIGMVQQEVYLFSGTVFENIAYGKPDATMEDVVRVAKAARIHSYISRLPQGYNTVLSDNGTSISKGQKQLLTIARAMLLDANMLILDEATSNVDTRTEQQIQAAMRQLMKGKTCFVIAHRLSTIESADHILVLDQGRVVEQGTHAELMAKDGFYKKLYESQFDSVS